LSSNRNSEFHRTLYLVRHGETEGHSSIRYYGSTDIALSELGRAQVIAAGEALRSFSGERQFPWIVTSPLSRALESAHLIEPNPAKMSVMDELRELDFGIFEGLTQTEIAERFPHEHARWMRERHAPHYTFPGGDNRGAFAQRVGRGVERLMREWNASRHQGPVVVVAHRGVIRAFIRSLTGIAPEVPLASIHILRDDGSPDGGRWRAEALDIIDHLAGF
jgi:broad specificity phosphatase PhoE